MSASTRCFSLVAALLLALASPLVWAHKASDAYLQLASNEAGTTMRVDVALRDLDVALDLDANADGELTWGEIRAAWPNIETYIASRVQVAGCELQPSAQALERRVDGVYAALTLRADCVPTTTPAIRYTVLREVDPTHRGIARIELAGQASVLRVLDPQRPERIVAATIAPPATQVVAAATTATRREVAAQPASTTTTEFLREGIHHILSGYDHVLFLLCLLLPSVMRRTKDGWRPVERLTHAVLPVFGIVTAFTLAHSITLALAAMKWVSLSPSFIEPAIAVTIVLAALDNLWPIFRGRRVIVTFFFGLIHGFGFAGVLAELNLPTAQFAWALLQFNVGLEVGQLMIVIAATMLLFLLRERPRYSQWAIGGGSAAAMTVGVLWFIERTTDLSLLPL